MFSDLRRLLAIATLIGGFVALGSASAQNQPLASPAAEHEASEADAPQVPGNYQLNPGDTVSVKVFREATLDTNQRISKDGTINFPLLGVIRIAGKTTNDAATMIAALLDKDYIIHPQVAVSIVTYIRQKYTVLGQVGSPGSYDIPEEQTIDILAAIAKAGGFTRLANPAKVTVRRFSDGHEEILNVDAKRLMTDKTSSRFTIQPNDTISVAERFF